MAGERSADEIQRDIEYARTSLAVSIDQLVSRTSPKRLADDTKVWLREQAQSPRGKAVIGAVGAFVAFRVVLRIVKHQPKPKS